MNKSRNSKKAQVSIQFNWIFVLIAGSIILLFFIGIVLKQKTASESKLAGSVAEDLKAILTGAGLSSGTVNIIQIPKIEISFTCDEDDDSWFGVDWERTGHTKKMPVEVIFSPNLIKGREIITWALGFSAPFKIMNFLYVTSPEIRYIFVYNQGNIVAEEIFNSLPDEMFKEHIESGDIDFIQDLNNYKVKFVYFADTDGPSELPPFFQGVDVSAIQILPGRVIKFWAKKGNSFVEDPTSFYLDKNTIYGAIFSENRESYECNLRKLFKRVGFVVDIYAMREAALIQHFSSITDYQSRCKDYYARSISSYKDAADLCIEDTSKCRSLMSYIESVKNNNNNLKQKSCPLLY